MAITKIEELYLYTSEVSGNSAENIQATAFMENSGVPFVKLMYNDKSQHDDVFKAINGWWERYLPAIDSFPFITYVEVHDDIPARYSPVKYLKGIDDIKTIVDIYNSTNT